MWQQTFNGLEYDAPLEIRYWRHPAQLAIISKVEYGTIYTSSVYPDGSKIRDKFEAAVITIVNGKLAIQRKFKLHGHRSKSQAEQIAILRTSEELEKFKNRQDNDKRTAMYTDSKNTLHLLQNKFKRNRLIETIRNKTIALMHLK
jgi:hypothetical protein